ncbi:aspartate aminotransferase family protein [Plasticicumulans acidivorans]|uniref:Acetylornithine aminotransferase n=1 Tax=Plasticicumulans acidivorans TaxID=886464 RepID=A0A317MTS7_9GAMM|nr:aspartate aminotransferase family protein [Plasticicumulans acidivorans]PWV61044.1 acetylornithine aminotransferase [Plasticicumulans acidivorans]
MIRPPSAASAALIEAGRRYYVPNYAQREMILDHGEGSRLWDIDGNEYIDLGAGIAVSCLGHQDPELVAALNAQAHKLWHTSNVYFTEPAIRLAEELVNASGFAARAFFCNSGAEANEAMIKLARRYATQHLAPEQREILTFQGSFHGRTLATVTATAQPKYQEGFEPLPGGFKYGPFNDVAGACAMIDERTCAVLVEPVQGEGGIMPADPGFLAALREACDRVGALLLFDEVQTGVGRTGRLFAHQWDGVLPDAMSMAKALGGGMPIGAMLCAPKTAGVLTVGSHGSTYGGNPLACAVARVILRRINRPQMLEAIERQGARLRAGLEALNARHGVFAEVRGRGLMIGAELCGAWAGRAGELTEQARLDGLLVLQAGPNVLRFVPPLNISDAELDEGLKRLNITFDRLLDA